MKELCWNESELAGLRHQDVAVDWRQIDRNSWQRLNVEVLKVFFVFYNFLSLFSPEEWR